MTPMKALWILHVFCLICAGAGCRNPSSLVDPHVYKEGRPYAPLITNPYKWAWLQFADGPISGSNVSDYAKRVLGDGVCEAHADLDGDGRQELLLRKDAAARVWGVLVFRLVRGGYRYVGTFSAGHLTVAPEARGSVLVFEPCGGHNGFLTTYRYSGDEITCAAREPMEAGDGAPEENNQKLERLFPQRAILKWNKVPNLY